MKLNINQLKKKNNIAFIYYLEKNNIPFYIGKTKNSKSREADWKREFGEDIIFNLIDECDNIKEIWKFWENHWIQQFKQWGFQLINQNEGGGGLNKHSDETIEKIRSKKIGVKQNRTKIRKDKGLNHIKTPGIKIGAPKGFKMSEEAKLSKNLKQKGKPKHTKEGKYKFVDKKIYSFININNNEEFKGIRYDFQKKFNLTYKGIYNLIANKAKTYRGWKLK
jgi:hypothetical protein